MTCIQGKRAFGIVILYSVVALFYKNEHRSSSVTTTFVETGRCFNGSDSGQNCSSFGCRTDFKTFQVHTRETSWAETTLSEDMSVQVDTPVEFDGISIVVELSGELGNHLSKIAFGLAIQELLRKQYGISAHLVLRHQESPKWLVAMRDVKQCFPNFRTADFSAGNTQEFVKRVKQQHAWLGDVNASKFVLPDQIEPDKVEQSLSYLQSLLREIGFPSNQSATGFNISLPFLHVKSFVNMEYVDTYIESFQKAFRFDEENCCGTIPDMDESVFHFRNFVTELPNRWKSWGFEELHPNQTADKLFGHLKPGDKVAIATRTKNRIAQLHQQTLEQRGLLVRIVQNQTGVQDFCFLTKTQKELVGNPRSTFFLWAALLGNASTVSAYSVRSDDIDPRFQKKAIKQHNWRNSGLRRIHFPVFSSDKLPEARRLV